MPKRPSGKSEIDGERRKFLKKSGAMLSGVALSPLSGLAGAENGENTESFASFVGERVQQHLWRRPNLLIIITDQERFPQHWPEGWADKNLPNRKRLADHGLTSTQAFTASAMCTPSRATLFTGLYPAEHKVDQTLRYSSTEQTALDQHTLQPPPPGPANMATMLASAGYNVEYRGKWHISKDPSGNQEIGSRRDLENYGFKGWEPPEAGADQHQSGFGGGNTNWDEWYASNAVDFLKNANPHASKPFALILCLVNPHDVMAYANEWNWSSNSDIPRYEGNTNYADVDLNAPPLDEIELPANFDQEPYKPQAQAQSTQFWAKQLGAIGDAAGNDLRGYLRFYAYLHQLSDQQIGRVLDVLEARPVLHRNTLVIRLADHGEMGLSHGGMRQKAYNAYEETIHVPLVVSNPKLFLKPVRTSALASLVDIMPTLATIADVPGKDKLNLKGTDLTPII
jgi:choline-sulfatase